MDEIIASVILNNHRSIHVASLSRQSVIDAGAEHMGFEGYFIFETDEAAPGKGIAVLAKVTGLDAAFRIIDLWSGRPLPNEKATDLKRSANMVEGS